MRRLALRGWQVKTEQVEEKGKRIEARRLKTRSALAIRQPRVTGQYLEWDSYIRRPLTD